VLYTSYRYFPRGTVFLAVVDPGVGTERKPVAIETRNYYFVGPDNGLLYPAASEDGILRVHAIDNEAVYRKPVSMSFHGRDIFAPAATLLAMGVRVAALGSPMDPGELVKLELRRSCKAEAWESIEAQVVYIDRFGNAALGLDKSCYQQLCRRGRVAVEAGKKRVEARCLPVFSHADRGELVFYINSLGFPELAVNLGSAARLLGLEPGALVKLVPV
jgi:S-adenosylmethionine hydrolase